MYKETMFNFVRRTVRNKIVGGMILLGFLSVVSLSLFYMPTIGMNGNTTTPNCLFMTHEVSVCSMSAFDHVGAWESAFLSIIPNLTVLLSILAGVIFLLAVAPNLLIKQKYRIPLLSKHLIERIYLFSYRQFQELFSRGILHPKLF